MRSKCKGQGIIEYSGALVLAAALVAAVMSAGVDGLTNLFVGIVDSVGAMLKGFLG
jgi:hypothetical protein